MFFIGFARDNSLPRDRKVLVLMEIARSTPLIVAKVEDISRRFAYQFIQKFFEPFHVSTNSRDVKMMRREAQDD